MYKILCKHIDRNSQIFVITTDQKIHIIEREIKLSSNITSIDTEKLIKTFFLSICLFSYQINFILSNEKNLHIDKKMTESLRRKIKEKNDYKCQICQEQFAIPNQQELTVHHIQPRSLGGKNIYQNLIPLCKICHSRLHELMDHIFINIKNEQHDQSNITQLFKKFVFLIEFYCKYFFENIKYKKFIQKNTIVI